MAKVLVTVQSDLGKECLTETEMTPSEMSYYSMFYCVHGTMSIFIIPMYLTFK